MKKRTIATILPIGIFVALAGCNEDKVETVRDVQYYMENEESRSAKLKECNNNPGELAGTPNCINASKAKMKSRSGMPKF